MPSGTAAHLALEFKPDEGGKVFVAGLDRFSLVNNSCRFIGRLTFLCLMRACFVNVINIILIIIMLMLLKGNKGIYSTNNVRLYTD